MIKADNYYNNNSNQEKDQSFKLNLSKIDHDLYKDEENKINQILRVKRTGNPNKGEKWRIYEDTKVLFTLDSSKLTKKECSFLRTPEGFNFLLSQFKLGQTAVSNIKKNMKILISA